MLEPAVLKLFARSRGRENDDDDDDDGAGLDLDLETVLSDFFSPGSRVFSGIFVVFVGGLRLFSENLAG